MSTGSSLATKRGGRRPGSMTGLEAVWLFLWYNIQNNFGEIIDMSKKKIDDRSTPLSGYKQEKKILTPPLATIPNMVLSSWTNDRMPDMLWAVLIRYKHPGNTGYAILRSILLWLQDNKGDNAIDGVTHTNIAAFNPVLRKKFITYIVEQAGTDALKPLILLKELPAYLVWKQALGNIAIDPEESYDVMAHAVRDVMFHQTQEATDVRWVKLMGTIISGKLKMPAEMIDGYIEYPNKYDQKYVRPSIRSAEMTTEMVPEGASEHEWPKKFWESMQIETVCIPEISTRKEDILQRYEKETEDKEHFNEVLPPIREALVYHALSTSTTTSIDSRHEAVFGLALYALDTFIENVILKVGGTSSGRVNARIIIEAYITFKYLLEKEKKGELLWDAYREYGSGQASLIERKYHDDNLESPMVDINRVRDIANEDKWQEYVPINLGNWDATDLRTISAAVGEKDLYDKYYPYTSGFMHSSWGAVREASMQSCLNPLHRLHRIPMFGLPVMPSANEDCRQILNKIFDLVNQSYPTFEHKILQSPSKPHVDSREVAS